MATYDCDDFRVFFGRGDAGAYSVIAIAADGRQVQTTFTLPMTSARLEEAVISLGRSRSRHVAPVIEPEVRADAEQLGGALAGALFNDLLGPFFEQARRTAAGSGRGLRLTLSLASTPELLSVPWELLYRRPTFLASQRRTPVVRYLEVGDLPLPLHVDGPVRILGVVASPTGLPVLDVAGERARVESALAGMIALGLVTLDWCDPATPRSLRERLRDGTFQVLHYVGHSDFTAEGDGLLFLANETGGQAQVTEAVLTNLLGDQSSLRLAILNSCEGARSTLTDPFAGIATSLVALGVPAVIAMQFTISDRAAIVFAEELFTSLIGRQYPVDAAVSEARKAVFTEVNEIEWATPVLFLRSDDGQLFDFATAPTALPLVVAPTPIDDDAPAGSETGRQVGTREHRLIPPPTDRRRNEVVIEARSTEMPSGTVTFLFTDIEGSTRRWESDPDAMRLALSAHDATLTAAIESRDGRLLKHTGDGVVGAFASAQDAVLAAVEAQLRLELPVRMGLATGEAQAEGNDYFGPPLNRAARVMAAGHGGQILLASSTAELVEGIELIDLGSRRLRDLSEALQIYQVCAEGLGSKFPPLKTADTVPGNLPAPTTSFVGRDDQIAELVALVAQRRLVTLTGVGGVGKTRLSIQVAAELTPRFADGVWLVELAPVGNPAAVPDTVATALAVTPQAGMSIIESLVLALSGRRLLIVFDNCEHVLDAAASVVEAILARTTTVSIITTSRESLGVGGEHSWPVPPLDVDAGVASPAVSLFVERATAVTPGFSLDEPGTADAVTEICRRLDGIALAIELAAARMVSMSAPEVRDRLGDRFRLLSGGRRGLQRHQTLRHAVQWSYDLLADDERAVLECCSVFADGFDLEAISTVHGSDDEYLMLDLMESLVRKSLLLAEQHGRTTRYRVLETIRQFGEERLAAGGTLLDVRDRHARFYSERTMRHWETWDGPGQLAGLDWADTEFANLRTAFRWATERGELATATAIAAHAAIMVWPIQRFEPVSWALEILDRVTEADLPHLPRLYVAASLCLYLGQPDLAVAYAQTATALGADARYDPFEDGWSEILEALAHLFAGRIERRVEITSELATRTGFARVVGLCGLTWALPAVGRADEAMAIADQAVDAARKYGSPFWIGWALGGYGRAFAEREPVRALAALREGIGYARENRLGFWEANLAQDAARLEASHGELDDALALFTTSIDSFHRAGNIVFLAAALASLAVFFDRFGRAEVAATVYGTSTRQASIGLVPNLGHCIAHLRSVLGEARFQELVALGSAQETADAVRFAQQEIERIGRELAPRPWSHSDAPDA